MLPSMQHTQLRSSFRSTGKRQGEPSRRSSSLWTGKIARAGSHKAECPRSPTAQTALRRLDDGYVTEQFPISLVVRAGRECDYFFRASLCLGVKSGHWVALTISYRVSALDMGLGCILPPRPWDRSSPQLLPRALDARVSVFAGCLEAAPRLSAICAFNTLALMRT